MNENETWFDYDVLLDNHNPVLGSFQTPPPIQGDSFWSSFPHSSSISVEIDGSFGNPDGVKETGSRKRMMPGPSGGSCNANGSKACREKMRRDRLNDSFMELSAVLDPGRLPKMDKSQILTDAVKMVNQLRDEAQKLKESNESLQEKVTDLKAEKNELRDEKQRLKMEKENLERQVQPMSAPAGLLPHPPPMAAPFSPPNLVLGNKPMPFVSYASFPGAPMWHFMQPGILNTSEDPKLYSPVA
ncbi:basic helix-loop-helix (bHLH) DNA-binding superfamily protein [Euphorbia peplus]|nr:basic helix-loop-helix (bHLH) DNA-binding superfamily protein [Euphorbia peplus]